MGIFIEVHPSMQPGRRRGRKEILRQVLMGKNAKLVICIPTDLANFAKVFALFASKGMK